MTLNIYSKLLPLQHLRIRPYDTFQREKICKLYYKKRQNTNSGSSALKRLFYVFDIPVDVL